MAPRLVQPRLQGPLEVAAAAWRDDPASQLASLDDADGGHVLDPELPRKIGTPVDLDADEVERVVVATPLQHLGDETLDAPAATRQR